MLEIFMTTPIKSDVKIQALIDTGYDGSLLLPSELFFSLNIPMIDEDDFRVYETPAGELLKLPCGVVQLVIAEKEFPVVEVEALNSINEVLVGRQLLNQLNLALLGTQTQLCFIEEDE